MVMSATLKNRAGERTEGAIEFISILNRVTFAQHLEDGKGANHMAPGGKAFQAEGTASAEAGGSMLGEFGAKQSEQGEATNERREGIGGCDCTGQCRPWGDIP